MKTSNRKEEFDILKEIFQSIKDPSQRIVAFVGSGLSRGTPAEIPTWNDSFVRLCARCRELGHPDIADKLHQIALLAEYEPHFLTACFDKLQNTMGKTAYEASIQDILSPKRPGTPPAVEILARIPFTGIITTNLDKLIEDGCATASENGKRPTLSSVWTSTVGSGQGNLARRCNWLWKIHGTIDLPDSWVFTSAQYAKSIYANEQYTQALQTIVQSARLVFLGYSISDPDIDRILTLLADYFGGRDDPHILLTRQASFSKKGDLANQNIQVLEYGGPEDHSALLEILTKFPCFKKGKHVEDYFDDSHYRRWLSDETGYIDIRGIGGGGSKDSRAIRFPILDLYTKLHVLKGPANWDLDRGKIRGEERTELTQVVNASRCVAIMGDPGSGKTTFLRYIARSYLEDPSKPLPFYFSVADVYDFIEKNKLELTSDTFIDFLLDLSGKKKLRLTREGLENRIKSGQCIWLLDSLDLISSAQDREAMVQVVEEASRRWEICKFVLVSRPRAMRGKAIPADFDLVGIDQMQEKEIRSFLETWTDLLFQETTKKTRRRYSDELLSIIRSSPDLRTISKNPVMLTCMAVVHYNQKRLPEGRADLLEAVIHWLISPRTSPSRTKYPEPRVIEPLYRELALFMFEKKRGPSYQIGRQLAAETIAKYFDGVENIALEFLTEEENERGLLVRRGEGDLAFWHQWFQEYLAAKEISGKTDDARTGWWSKLRYNLDKIEWREIISFVPACLIRLGSDRVDLFFTRLFNSCADADLVIKARRAGLGGSILKNLRVIGYEPKNIIVTWNNLLKDILLVFKEEGERIPLEDRYEAAVAYGLGGDSRLRNFEETWIQLPGEIFQMGAQAHNDSSTNYDPEATLWEGPVTELHMGSFEIRKYQITLEEFALFVSDDGYHKRNLWSEEGWHWRRENDIETPGDWEDQLLFPNCPVTLVSWFEAVAYCQWLTLQQQNRNVVCRLPSEAEWEYAAKRLIPAGQRFIWGNDMIVGDRAEANWAGCNLRKKTPIGMFPKSNTTDGIADMIGNVEEWCADSWSPDYANYPKDGTPRMSNIENRRVVRGGSTIRYLRLCRPTYRSRTFQHGRYATIGFRSVRNWM